MLEILWISNETHLVTFAVTDVSHIGSVSSDSIEFSVNGHKRSCRFPPNERIEIAHKTDARSGQIRTALIRDILLSGATHE